ncbi:MAG: DNA primase [Candidatus Yanofskybacteria bacterium CG10_big_fil_rev_8_21_14_0_10_36_16]|uniref:DNA primase n=1 Tax=Candidatus Yanofskybacteria bacterium CG10_big_fil_rev_8_21_14_0_10_36_16 TaxID=1975096 RepID=A0A2J0Q859_9BACT|nr:MAG: DNA primase [Candidatus Yanofskybacteria bacterium CG10_big_fil_rev_8_21_14_0_10_36_16]
MEDNVSKIKDRLDIVDVIGGYVKLNKSGINYKAQCPFHNEKTPSFFVNPERQIFHCFGCSKGGDMFTFVQEIEGLEFPEVLKMLATKAGVELKQSTPEYKEFQSEKTILFEISELATKFFEKQLWHSNTGKNVLKYLHERGTTDESIKNFRLGFAPDDWSSFSNFAKTRGYSEEEISKSGMGIKRNVDGQGGGSGSGIYDRFRNRIMFPVTNLSGQVVGFSGRIFDVGGGPTSGGEAVAKYINTPQTPIYDKSRLLYGLDKARMEIRSKDKCLAVEGNMDVVMSHQAGVGNAVATSGTALTASHLKIIKRYTDNLDLCFDEDAAGEIATQRGVDLALAQNFNVGVISIDDPKLKDPSDYVKAYGSKWEEYSSKSKPFMEYFFKKVTTGADTATALGKKMVTQKLLPIIKSISSKVEQAHWVAELALKVKTKEDLIYNELNNIAEPVFSETSANYEYDDEGSEETGDIGKFKHYEQSIAELVCLSPELIRGVDFKHDFWSNELIELLDYLNNKSGKENTNENTKKKVDLLHFRAEEIWKDFSDESKKEEFAKLIYQAKLRNIQKKLGDLSFEIRETEKTGNKEQLTSLVAKFTELSGELAKLK